MKEIRRPLYIDRLASVKNTSNIKIITGVRRSGKSKLMKDFIRFIEERDLNSNIILIDFIDIDFEYLKEYHKLHDYIESKYKEGCSNYLFIDEVQMCPSFEITINSLYSKNKYDIYITGSNAFLLSSDLATLFVGRYIEISILPFSYKEFLQYYGVVNNDESFEKYVEVGGFAGSYDADVLKEKYNYLRNVYETIILKDLVTKHDIKDAQTLRKVGDFLLDNISNLTSANNITNCLKNTSISTNHVTIGKYLKILCEGFIFYETNRYDLKGKSYLNTSFKYYLVDVGLRFAIQGRRNIDYGRIYENLVFLELKRRGYDIYIGKLYQKEIDFVVMNSEEKIYIQVSDDISNPETFEREYKPLLQIKDAYPKMIISRTKHPKYTYEGIIIIDIKDFLSME